MQKGEFLVNKIKCVPCPCKFLRSLFVEMMTLLCILVKLKQKRVC